MEGNGTPPPRPSLLARARSGLRDFNWVSGTFIIGYHVALLVGLPFYFAYATVPLGTVVASCALLVLTEIGIGAAYHRYYAHRAYSLGRLAEGVLLFLSTLATQGSVLQWAHDHRLHHAFVDTDRDPYSIKKGFWYAHVLWIFEKSKPLDERRISDLLKNPWIVFQHRWIGTLTIGSNFLVFVVGGALLGDWLGAFVLLWWTRLAVSHHLTWFINSLAHWWGSQTYSKEHSAVDNYVLAMLTVGEGYHNFHHTFPSDYRNGVRWWHFDPTKWTIWGLSKLGLAGDLKRYDEIKIRRRLLLEDRRVLLERLSESAHRARTELEQRAEALCERVQAQLTKLGQLIEQRRRLERDPQARHRLRDVRRELRALRQSLRRDWRSWNQLCEAVL